MKVMKKSEDEVAGIFQDIGKTQQRLERLEAFKIEEYEKYLEGNFIFGYGFSKITRDFYDVHVAYVSVPLVSGILGSLLILFFIVKTLVYNLNYYFRSPVYKNTAILFIAAYLGLLIIGVTSTSIYTYLIGTPQAMLIALLLLFNEMVYKNQMG